MIPVIEEEIELGRRVVDAGALRVRKVIDEEVVQLDEPLLSEHAVAERVPVGRVIDQPVGVRQEGEVTIVPVMHERLVLRRELVLVEEVRITRRRETRLPEQDITLRRERVIVERFDPVSQAWQPAAAPAEPVAGTGPPDGGG